MSADMPRHASCGLDFSSVPDLKAALSVTSENGYTFACFPIVHPRFKRELIKKGVCANNGAFTRSDLLLTSQDWCNMVVGKLSEYLDCDSTNVELRKHSEACIAQELMFATHLGLSAIMLKLHGTNHVNMARIIYDKSFSHNSSQIWVHVPMVSPEVNAAFYREGKEPPDIDTWKWWNEFRLMCDSSKRIGVALEVSADLPDEPELARWLGEPLRALIVPTSLFITNKKMFPVLSQRHQAFIKRAAALDLQFIVTGANRHSSLKHYMQYIDHLYLNSNQNEITANYARGYEDYLQIPLQPLMDNLESNTYEVFEKDPVKYTEYQSAMYQALLDRVPDEEAETNTQVIMVVGAGRGPLVNAARGAAARANRKIRVYAVEKNPNAVVTLFSLKEEVWKDSVTVVSCDMRDWDAPEQCDILVSELLGSFGDNELSPECLDGPQKFLKPDGISIPSSYTSYLCPLQSSKLYNEAKGCNTFDKPHYAKFEMPYVVHQLNTYKIAPPKPVFTFHHPIKEEIADHTRYAKLNFQVDQDAVLHGFSGFFDTVLYKDIKLSIVPDSYSKGMFSWFPIYFPIKDPVQLKMGDEIEAHFWRLANKKDVWYEWSISKPLQLPIHNPNGRSHSIGLFC